MAEFDNFKKRSAKEREGLYNSIISDIAVTFLPVIDNLEKAVSVQTEDANYKLGVELVLKQFKDVLKSKGIEEIKTIGETFDPELHEETKKTEQEDLNINQDNLNAVLEGMKSVTTETGGTAYSVFKNVSESGWECNRKN